MTRTPFFLCVASLFTPSAVSFMVINNDSQSLLRPSSARTVLSSSSSRSVLPLQYANTDVVEDTTTNKLDSFRNSIINSLKRIDDENEQTPKVDDVTAVEPMSTSDLLTKQLVREFTTARRYLLAAGAIKGMSEYFYAQEEQQRFRAMELIEYARSKGIELASDYSDMIIQTPIDKKLPTSEFVQELLKQDQQDLNFLDTALAQIVSSKASSSSDPDLVDFLETVKLAYVDRQHEFIALLTQSMPSLDISTSMGGIVLDQATAATGVDASAAATTTSVDSTTTAVQSSAEDIVSRAAAGSTTTTTTSGGWNLPSSIPKSEDLVGEVGSALPDPHMVVAATIGVAAVGDTDALPSTGDILDALPISDEIVEMVTDALPSTEDILDALPISLTPDDIQQAVDNFDAIQQNLMDAETLSQIVDVVTGLV